jgi:prepilin-type N-terminal cleavage/methylation domain-containing protein
MRYRWRVRGFTLIELLVVITVIAILAGVTVPVVKNVLDKGRQTSARAAVASIETAWELYLQEYGKWPIDGRQLLGQNPGEPGTNLDRPRAPYYAMKVEEAVVALLTGDPDDYLEYKKEDHNPKGRQFLEINQEFLKRGQDSFRYGTYVDPWGKPYLFLLDVDFDNRVKHPIWHRDSREPPIAKRVIAWSTGPVVGDQESPEARRDDIVSW